MYASFSLARPSATIRRKRSRTCLRRRARHAKKPGAVSARACCTIFSGYAFLHESRNKVKQNFSVADSQRRSRPARIPGPRAGLSASAGIAFMRLAAFRSCWIRRCSTLRLLPPPLVGSLWARVGEGDREICDADPLLSPPHPQPFPTRAYRGWGARRVRGTFVRQQHRNTL